jgi:hypothetical protein
MAGEQTGTETVKLDRGATVKAIGSKEEKTRMTIRDG